MSRKKSELLEGITKDVVTSKIIANNTLRIEYADGSKTIRLHNTDVVTTLPNGNITLNSGGWKSSTTKDRVNTFSPFRVSQSKGIWSVNGQDFYDGITFKPDGSLVGKSKPVNMAKVTKQKARIAKFVAQITPENLPMPSAGDCFLCRIPGNTSCLSDHLRENYLHGSLLVQAMRAKGYQDQQIGTHYTLKIADTFKRAVRSYMSKALVTNAISR